MTNDLQLVLYPFFFNATATAEIYTLSLHDALPISDGGAAGSRLYLAHPGRGGHGAAFFCWSGPARPGHRRGPGGRSEGTRLNSSHSQISYAVFCLKKKNKLDAYGMFGTIE